jgi:hypothetical protein
MTAADQPRGCLLETERLRNCECVPSKLLIQFRRLSPRTVAIIQSRPSKKPLSISYFSALSALHHERSLILGSCDVDKAHLFGDSRDLRQYLCPNLRNNSSGRRNSTGSWQRKMMSHATTYEEVEGVSSVNSEAVHHSTLPVVTRHQFSLSCWIYLAAISVATLGWVWFLARIALLLVQAVWSSF